MKYLYLFLLQDDILCLFQVCQEINPTDVNLITKCSKLLVKVLPKLGNGDDNIFKNTISWILLCIVNLKNHQQYSENINEILHFYVCTIQTYKNLNINNEKVRHFLYIFRCFIFPLNY